MIEKQPFSNLTNIMVCAKSKDHDYGSSLFFATDQQTEFTLALLLEIKI